MTAPASPALRVATTFAAAAGELATHPRLDDPRLYKLGGILTGGLGVAALVYMLLRDPTSPVNRALSAYADHLERRMRTLFLPPNARSVMIAQGVSMYAVVATSVALHKPQIAPFALLVGVLPIALLELKVIMRVRAIEAQTDAFILTLANALKATPSVADAFISLIPVVAEPLKSEIVLATKQMRLGVVLEDALLQMATRIGSRTFDTALASVLIGQRVGGNLPKILETSAQALRELFRLEGMMRAKTASGRIQMWVIVLAPILFVVYFDQTQPGYFDPMMESSMGKLMLAAAIVMWILAIFIGRRVLKVDV
jgi:tight adherence protein B